jgi:hypothetical protein
VLYTATRGARCCPGFTFSAPPFLLLLRHCVHLLSAPFSVSCCAQPRVACCCPESTFSAPPLPLRLHQRSPCATVSPTAFLVSPTAFPQCSPRVPPEYPSVYPCVHFHFIVFFTPVFTYIYLHSPCDPADTFPRHFSRAVAASYSRRPCARFTTRFGFSRQRALDITRPPWQSVPSTTEPADSALETRS